MKTRNLFLALVCSLSLAATAAVAETKVEYMALFIGAKKMGYVRNVREAADKLVTTTQETVFSINRMGMLMTVKVVETAVETAEGKALAFKSVQDMGFMSQTVEGKVDPNGTVHVTTIGAGQKKTSTKAWPEGALLSEGMRLLSVKQGLKEGTKYSAKAYMASMLCTVDADVTIGAMKDVDLLGRTVRLTEAKTILTAPTGKIESTGYMDENADAQKVVTPMMGMQMEMVACSKEVALSPSDPLDFFDKVLASSPTPLEGVGTARSITYRISPVAKKADLSFVNSPSQQSERDKDGNSVVTVSPVKIPRGDKFPYKGTDADALKALKPTRFLECDANEVRALATKAIGKAADVAEAATNVETFVGRYINKKDLSVGYASALETVRSRQGDCTEHAVLAAAMCRAAGIPAQVVTGLAYVKKLGTRSDVFAPHAWFRVLVGGKWIDYDAALKAYDAGHIALSAGDGDPSDFFGVVGTLGNIKIVEVTVKP
jgi:hypothetical protein